MPWETDFRPVYLIGAGISSLRGIPVMDSFVPTARRILHSGAIEQNFGPGRPPVVEIVETKFGQVFDLQDRLTAAKFYWTSDVDHLESLFSMIDMYDKVRTQAAEDKYPLREAFFSLLAATMKLRLSETSTAYDRQINYLTASPNSTIITTNYDIEIERALSTREKGRLTELDYLRQIAFCVDSNPFEFRPERRLLLKLHGSIDWLYCPKCQKLTHLREYKPDFDFVNNYGNHHRATDPHGCLGKTSFLLVPPTWNKAANHEPLNHVWREAAKRIGEATHIAILGYSFPSTDQFMEHLFSVALHKNRTLRSLVVVNESVEVGERVKKMLEPSFARRCFKHRKANLSLDGSQHSITGPILDENSYLAFFRDTE